MPISDSKPTSDNPQTKAPQNVQYAAPYPQQFEDDTIDLYELWITLWNKKWLVIAVTVIATLGSVVYALLVPQIYKAEALLLPPSAKDVQSLNAKGVQVVEVVEVVDGVQLVQGVKEQAFAAFKKNLSSRSLQKKFIDEQGLMDILAPDRSPETRNIEILESFATMIKIENRKARDGTGMAVSMESSDPRFAAKLVNDYVSFFDLETVRGLISEARNTIWELIMDIEYKIFSKRQMAKQRREDQILRFEEALIIARKLAIRERVDTNTVVQNNQLNISISKTPPLLQGIQGA